MTGAARTVRGIPWQSRLDFRAAPSASVFTRRSGGIVIKIVRPFPQNAATDETLECAQRSLVFRGNKAYRIANGMSPPGSADAMNIIFGMHRKVVVHYM
jgi:hypothetical protein